MLVFVFGATARNGRANVGQKFFVVPGFLDEIGGAVLHGADRVIDGAVSGDHDDSLARIAAANIGQDLQPVAVRERKVQQHEIEWTLCQTGEAFFSGLSRLYAVAFKLEQSFQRLADRRLIVNDENGAFGAGGSGLTA